jgi:hypothetical protein
LKNATLGLIEQRQGFHPEQIEIVNSPKKDRASHLATTTVRVVLSLPGTGHCRRVDFDSFSGTLIQKYRFGHTPRRAAGKMTSASSISDDSSILAPDSTISETASQPPEPHYEYQTFERPNGGEATTKKRLMKMVCCVAVVLLLAGVVFVYIKLARR